MNNINSIFVKWAGVSFFVLSCLLAIAVFRPVVGGDSLLFTTDANIGALTYRKTTLPEGFLGFQPSFPLQGSAAIRSVKVTNVLMWLLPVQVFNDWIYAVLLVGSAFFLALYLRARGIGWGACGVGGLAAYWIGSNLTLVYPGHIEKFAVMMFGTAALWLIEKSVQTKRLSWTFLVGGAMGAMFLEQQDVALFFGLFIGIYAVYAVIREFGIKGRSFLYLICMPIVAIAVAAPAMLTAYQRNVSDVAVMSESEEKDSKWNYCTQWSVCPSESIEFIAPGFMGLRSNDPAGPYWGKTGQSADWKKTGKGFRNFRLESVYIGVIPISFGFLAILLSVAFGKRVSLRSDVYVWSAIAFFALLLSFGRFFPLYRLLFQIPFFSTIRNPNKFLPVFQLAAGVLAAYGIHFVASLGQYFYKDSRKRLKYLFWGISIFSLLPLLGWITAASISATITSYFVEAGWPRQYTPVMTANIVSSLRHATIMGAIFVTALGFLLFLKGPNRTRIATYVVAALICTMVIDSLMLASLYIVARPSAGYIDKNAVVTMLEHNPGKQRVALIDQTGFYNQWLGVLFPRFGISCFNIYQMPRMPSDYKNYLAALSRSPLRLWQLSAVGYVLAPIHQWENFLKTVPGVEKLFEPILRFNVFPYSGGVGVTQVPLESPAQHQLLRFRAGLPRFSFIGGWEVVAHSNVLNHLTRPSLNPHKTAFVSDSPEVNLPAKSSSGGVGLVKVKSFNARTAVLNVAAEAPGIVLISQRYTPGLVAKVDGERTPVLRCNFLSQGIYVDKGDHEVSLSYVPGASGVIAPLVGLAICVCSIAILLVMHRKKGQT